MVKTLALLGSTGSIGRNVCAVARQYPDRFQIAALAAGRNVEELARQAVEFDPAIISVAEERNLDALAALLPAAYKKRLRFGEAGLLAAATEGEADTVVNALVGAVGLKPTWAALRAGKNLALANKETLVMAGELVMAEAARRGLSLLPIDSEHSAIFQSLQAGRREDVAKLILTASGGPFRTLSPAELDGVTPKDALAHPNWSMGKKITIDSATLMNKGLELIEARWLFDVEPSRLEVLVHPQSVVHSLVEFTDGAVVAQLGIPDMRIPIALALSFPERLPLDLPRLNLAQIARLDFEAPDAERFPALKLALEALEAGGLRPAVLNAANEIAVAAFLDGRIRFPGITALVAETLAQFDAGDAQSAAPDIDAILAADAEARARATELLPRFAV